MTMLHDTGHITSFLLEFHWISSFTRVPLFIVSTSGNAAPGSNHDGSGGNAVAETARIKGTTKVFMLFNYCI